MKFSRLILLWCGLLMSGSLMATENPKIIINTTYMGYESVPPALSYPLLGHRIQMGNYIFDLNIGYTYYKSTFPILGAHHQWAKMGINGYRSVYQTKNGQIYVGVGADFVFHKTSSWYGGSVKFDSFLPSISLGNDFYVDKNKKMFFELTYKPYSFEKDDRTSVHLLGYRIGIGF